MSGLIKSLGPRNSRKRTEMIARNAAQLERVQPVVKGGGNVYQSIASITSMVNSALGQYSDDYVILRTEESVREYFKHIREQGVASIDTETSSLDPISTTLAGVCLYTRGQKACYIPLNHVSYVTLAKIKNQVDVSVIADELAKCNEADVRWLMHNAKFDIRVLRHQANIRISSFWDTYLAAKCLNENEPAGLKELHMKYCNSKDDKLMSYSKLFGNVEFTMIPIDTAYLYAAGDAIKTFELFEFQQQHLTRANLPGCYNVFRNLEMKCVEYVADMEDCGIGFDLDYCIELEDEHLAKREECLQVFYDHCDLYAEEIDAYRMMNPGVTLDNPILITSPSQLAILLYDIIKVPVVDNSKPRGTGEDILNKLDLPICKAILDFRAIDKRLTTYITKMPDEVNAITGRIHCNFNQYGARTGRFSSDEPNMQNIPSRGDGERIRRMFVAPDEHLLISADFSQQEPRTLAHFSQDTALMQAYLDNKDIYAWIGQTVYSVPYEECLEFRADGTYYPDGDRRRDNMKGVLLGLMYGRGNRSIAEELGITLTEATNIIDTFYDEFPLVKEWMDTQHAFVREYGYVETVLGRKRRLPDLLLPDYTFSLAEGYTPGFNPLDFTSEQDITYEVPQDRIDFYVNRLSKAWGRQKGSIINQAKQEGIIIQDNGGFKTTANQQVINSIIQGSAADQTKLALIALAEDSTLKKMGCKPALQIHDEIIAICPESHANEASERMAQLMVESVGAVISVPMKCDVKITKAWAGEEVA